MAYSEKLLEHYENPKNVGVLDKDDDSVGTGLVGAPACLHPDTLVAVADGRQYVSIKQLAEEGKDVPIYAYHPDNGIIIAWGRNPRLTRQNSKLVRTILDDESSFLSTPDHLIHTRNRKNNIWICAKDLKTNQSLMPFTYHPENLEAFEGAERKVLSVEPAETTDVYCLSVDNLANFAIITNVNSTHHTGIIVHNCGDVMRLQIKVSDDGIIEDARFKTFGCGSAIASSSLITEWVKGKDVQFAEKIKNQQIVEELSLPPVKVHCSVLAEDAIKSAVADWRMKQEAKKARELIK